MPETRLLRIEEINPLPQAQFIQLLGALFEKSPWVPEQAWQKRPFASRDALLAAMAQVVEDAGEEKLITLIQAHPDLGARLEERAALTPESFREQGGTGLFAIAESELEQLRALNADYAARFDFPFVICARLNSISTIFNAIKKRLTHPREEEVAEAWTQIQKIAALRLNDLATE